jgi:uncharacterized protein
MKLLPATIQLTIYSFVVFGTYGGFWLTFGATLQPFYNAWGAYATDPTNPATGLQNPDFYNSFGFFFLSVAFLSLLFLIASVRTNIAFVIIFISLTVGFGALTGTYWQVANGNASLAGKLQTTAGAFLFITSASGWWILLAILLASVDFPLSLPGKFCSHVLELADDW